MALIILKSQMGNAARLFIYISRMEIVFIKQKIIAEKCVDDINLYLILQPTANSALTLPFHSKSDEMTFEMRYGFVIPLSSLFFFGSVQNVIT